MHEEDEEDERFIKREEIIETEEEIEENIGQKEE